jgi:hypothetical protein
MLTIAVAAKYGVPAFPEACGVTYKIFMLFWIWADAERGLRPTQFRLSK